MSGNLFQDVVNITLPELEHEWATLKRVLLDAGCTRVEPVGSTFHRPLMGDVDVAVAHPDGRDGLLDALKKRFQCCKVSNDLVSFRYPCDGKHVQVDAFVGNVDYLMWSRCFDPTPRIRSAARAVLWNTILRVTTAQQLNELERSRVALDFGEGLVQVLQSRQGKRGPVKEYFTVEKTFISNDPVGIVDYVLGPHVTVVQTSTFPGLLKAGKSLFMGEGIERFLDVLRRDLIEADQRQPGSLGDLNHLLSLVH